MQERIERATKETVSSLILNDHPHQVYIDDQWLTVATIRPGSDNWEFTVRENRTVYQVRFLDNIRFKSP